MKHILCLVVLLGAGLSAASLAQTPGNAIDVDPDVHRVVIDNEFFRLFDARASKGAKSPMHSHAPMVLVSLGKTRLRMTTPDGKTAIHDFSASQPLWLPEGGTHSWKAIAGSGRVIAIEVKAAARPQNP